MSLDTKDAPVQTDHSQDRRFRLPRLERGGLLWGMQAVEFAVVAVDVLIFVLLLGSQHVVAGLLWLVIGLPLAIAALAMIGGRSVLRHLGVRIAHQTRVALGETRWRTTEAPVPAGTVMLPGDVGRRITVHATEYEGGGGIFYDASAKRATAVLRCESEGWALASDQDRAARGRAMTRMCNALVRRYAVERVTLMARTIPSETRAARLVHEQTVEAAGVQDPWCQDVMAEVFAGDRFVDSDGELRGSEQARVAVSRDVLVAVSISVPKAQKAIQSYGGSIAGAGAVLRDELRALREKLRGCGVSSTHWLTPAELGDVVRIAADPTAVEKLAETREDRDEAVFSTGVALLVDETDPRVLDTGSGVHSTWWIDEWPQTDVQLGFLSDVICSGSYAHVVTQVFTVLSTGAGLRQVRKGVSSLVSKMDINQKLKRPTSILDQRAMEDLEVRENELADGNADVRVTGYIRVSAKDRDELELADQDMISAASSLDVQRLDGQHFAGWVASSIPVGWGL